MRYTLWSRGRLLGETDLGFIFRYRGFRCGWLEPIVLGERLLPAATAVAPAIRIEYLIGSDATTRADVLSAVDQEDALELVLRGQDGTVIATEDIGIIDTHYLLSIAESDADDMSALDADQDVEMESLCEEWTAERELVSHQRSLDEESEFPRYQIQIRLVDHDSLP